MLPCVAEHISGFIFTFINNSEKRRVYFVGTLNVNGIE